MATPDSQLEELRQRLGHLLEEWGTEISAVMSALESRQSQDATHSESARALEQARKEAEKKDLRYAELEKAHAEAHARIAELERKLSAPDLAVQRHKDGQQAEVEAMRAELAARKSLVKNLRSDAERGKALEKELTQYRKTIATMKESIERDARTIAELRLSSNSWERKYRKLAEAGLADTAHGSDRFSYSEVFTETGVSMYLDETAEVDGARTVVIDMTEPLREARDERLRKSRKAKA